MGADSEVLETKRWNAKDGFGLEAGTSSQCLGNRVTKFCNPCENAVEGFKNVKMSGFV